MYKKKQIKANNKGQDNLHVVLKIKFLEIKLRLVYILLLWLIEGSDLDHFVSYSILCSSSEYISFIAPFSEQLSSL